MDYYYLMRLPRLLPLGVVVLVLLFLCLQRLLPQARLGPRVLLVAADVLHFAHVRH